MVSCAKRPIFQAQAYKSVVTEENTGRKWDQKLLYDTKSGLFYGVYNDNINLGIRFKINDKNVQRKILMKGLSIWIDTTSHKKNNLGIKYPLTGTAKYLSTPQSRGLTIDNDNIELLLKRIPAEIELVGFERISSQIVNNNEKNGIAASMETDDHGIMYYELTIPLEKIFNKNIMDIESLPLVSLGFVTGYFSNQGTGMGRPGGQQMTAGGGGGRGSGGRGGGSRGGSSSGGRAGGGVTMGGNRPMAQGPDYSGYLNDPVFTSPTTFWLKKIQLSVKK